jgi:hypothetical protein
LPLKQTLEERDIEFKDGTAESLKEIVQRGARRRKRPWFSATSVEILTSGIGEQYADSVVDLVFWWLVVYGVITFDNIDQWTDDEWAYEDSQKYAIFTERGVVLLNELKTAGSKDRK